MTRTIAEKITDKMREVAYATFRNSHARANANYPIALELLGECEHPLFPWEIDEETKEQARQINDILFNEYLRNI